MSQYNHLNWKEIAERIFSLYGAETNKELASKLGFSVELVRKWRETDEEKRRIPTWDTLEKVVCEQGVRWEWLLTGTGNQKYTPPAKAGGEREVDVKLIDVIFQAQEHLAHLGHRLAGGQPENTFPDSDALKDIFQKLQGHLEVLKRSRRNHDRTA